MDGQYRSSVAGPHACRLLMGPRVSLGRDLVVAGLEVSTEVVASCMSLPHRDMEAHGLLRSILRILLKRRTRGIELNRCSWQPHAEDVLVSRTDASTGHSNTAYWPPGTVRTSSPSGDGVAAATFMPATYSVTRSSSVGKLTPK